jgi:hypothetical protein
MCPFARDLPETRCAFYQKPKTCGSALNPQGGVRNPCLLKLRLFKTVSPYHLPPFDMEKPQA